MNLCKKIIMVNAILLVFFSCKKENNIDPRLLSDNSLETQSATQSTALPASLITDLQSGTSKTYQLGTTAVNMVYYTDRAYTVTTLPTVLRGIPFIKTACDDKINQSAKTITFTLTQDATLYVAYDSRADVLPGWLSSWKKLASYLRVTDKVASLHLYTKNFKAGAVSLGGNLSSPAKDVHCQYFVMIKGSGSASAPVTTPEPDPGKETTPPPVENTNFLLGVNGHSLGLQAYLAVPIPQQIAMLKKMGMNIYRQDISFKSDGTISSLNMFDQLYNACTSAGITILPMLYTKSLDFNDNENQAYSKGRTLGSSVASKNAKYFKYYELGNELDNQLILPVTNGDQTTDYNAKKFKIVAAYLKGMDEGIKSVQPGAKTMVNAGWVHYAYLQMLQAYGVKFDIIAYHWYSDMETSAARRRIPDITQKLSSLFTQPIWFTEAGQRPDQVNNIEQVHSDFVTSLIKKCKANPQVKALMFYELFDEPGRSTAEAHFGFIKWTNPYNTWEYKTAAKSLFVN